MTDAIPQAAYYCPHCRQASGKINRVETIEVMTPHTYCAYNEQHMPDYYHVEKRTRMSRWECALCGKVIEDVEKSLVNVTIIKVHTEPTDIDVDEVLERVKGTGFDSTVLKNVLEPDPLWLKRASKDKPPGNPDEDDAEDLGQEPDY